jgi:hypothetical protein
MRHRRSVVKGDRPHRCVAGFWQGFTGGRHT